MNTIKKSQPIRRAYHAVAEDLIRLITNKYEVGERIPSERELVKRYGVSRPTVREALLALSISGLVDIRNKGGVYVAEQKTSLNLNDAGAGPFETIAARLLIEPEIAAMAAVKSSDALVNELNECIDMMRVEHQKGYEADEGDHKFHLALANATENGMLVAISDQLWCAQLESPLWENIHSRMKLHRYWGVWISDHQAILDGIKLSSPIQTRNAMIKHLENIRNVLMTNSVPK